MNVMFGLFQITPFINTINNFIEHVLVELNEHLLRCSVFKVYARKYNLSYLNWLFFLLDRRGKIKKCSVFCKLIFEDTELLDVN